MVDQSGHTDFLLSLATIFYLCPSSLSLSLSLHVLHVVLYRFISVSLVPFHRVSAGHKYSKAPKIAKQRTELARAELQPTLVFTTLGEARGQGRKSKNKQNESPRPPPLPKILTFTERTSSRPDRGPNA